MVESQTQRLFLGVILILDFALFQVPFSENCQTITTLALHLAYLHFFFFLHPAALLASMSILISCPWGAARHLSKLYANFRME